MEYQEKIVNYLTKKLEGNALNIKNQEKRIVDAVTGMHEIKSLKDFAKMTEVLLGYKERCSEYQNDALNYLSISDIIGLYEKELISSSIAGYHFRFKRTVTLVERDALVAAMGYTLKEAKIA